MRAEYNDASPISLLIQALNKSKVDIPQNTLREIKAVELKQNQMKRNPELYINGNETLLDPVIFNLEGKALSVPSMRLKGLPGFDPVKASCKLFPNGQFSQQNAVHPDRIQGGRSRICELDDHAIFV